MGGKGGGRRWGGGGVNVNVSVKLCEYSSDVSASAAHSST